MVSQSRAPELPTFKRPREEYEEIMRRIDRDIIALHEIAMHTRKLIVESRRTMIRADLALKRRR